MEKLLEVAGQKVFTATSWTEYERLQQEGAVFEGLVLDPACRWGRGAGNDRCTAT